MPRYRVKEKSLIGNEVFEAGAEVDYDGLPAENLEPLCDEGKAKYQEYLDSNAARVKLMVAQNSESAVGDSEAFSKALTKAMSESQAAHNEAMSKAISEGIAAGIAQAMAAVSAGAAKAPSKGPAKEEKASLV